MPSPKSKWTRRLVRLILLIAGLAAYRYWPQPEPISIDAVRRPRLAILVFENLNKHPDVEFLSHSLTRDTTTKVGQLFTGQLDVAAYPSVANYHGTRKSLQQIGRELELDYVLQGGARQDEGRVHLSIQMKRISDESLIWTQDYDRPLEEISDVQNQIVEKIGSSLKLTTSPADLEAIKRTATNSAAAREAYLRGVDLRESGTEGDLKKSIDWFGKSIKADPRYARAHAALAEARLYAHHDVAEVEKQARQALAMTGAIPQAHTVLAEVLYKHRGDDKAAQQEFDKALALNRSDATAHLRYAEFLMTKHRLDEAQVEIQTTLELDPFSFEPNLMAGRIFTASKMFERAMPQFEKTVTLDRNSPETRFYMGQAYLAQSMNEAAIREFQRAVSFGPDQPEYLAALGEVYAATRKFDEARLQLEALKKLAKRRPVPPELIESLSQHINPS